jgi:hypothetical protein
MAKSRNVFYVNGDELALGKCLIKHKQLGYESTDILSERKGLTFIKCDTL